MVKSLIFSLLLIIISPENFKTQQLKYERVRAAYDDKSEAIFALLKSKNLQSNKLRVFFRVFKQEQKLEIWAKNEEDTTFQILKIYDIASPTGDLGPKRKQGDMQTPEGFYFIDRFNPVSNFHLSLGINYPNESDKIFGEKGNLGGDIFIHGSTVTVGCMPMTDDKIKEIYILSVEAKNAGQTQIPVHIFPMNLSGNRFKNLEKYAQSANFLDYWSRLKGGQKIDSQRFIEFWANLKIGFDAFEQNHVLPKVLVNKDGAYSF
ncbi:MAG: L,D-transpeptidase family protein [Arcicella sp.]|nr:L,D-transpeptidase family protein [Arcicella sp.]